MTEAGGRPAAVLDRLKRLYGLSDADIASAFGMAAQEIGIRRRGRRGFTPELLAGLAAFFGVPVEVFFMEPAKAVAIVLERDPELQGPYGAGETNLTIPAARAA